LWISAANNNYAGFQQKNGLVPSRPIQTIEKRKLAGCIQTIEKRAIDCRPWRKEKWTGCIQTLEKRTMGWLYPAHEKKKTGLVAFSPSTNERWAGWLQTNCAQKLIRENDDCE
jgi:hypothetical protein